MKKLFFTALVAIVAVGGALTVNASGIYYDASSNPVDCTGNGALCSSITPVQTLWTQPDQQGQSFPSSQLDDTNKFN